MPLLFIPESFRETITFHGTALVPMADNLGGSFDTKCDVASTADLWIPNSNKIPKDLTGEYCRELFGRPAARWHFISKLGECMLARTTGYVSNMQWFQQWDLEWNQNSHPAVALQAARSSPFPPDEQQLQRWCMLHYPDWVPELWPLHQAGTPTSQPLEPKACINLDSMD